MIIAIELNAAQSEQLKAIAASMRVPAEELAQAAVTDLIGGDAADFEAAARVGCESASVAIDALHASAHPTVTSLDFHGGKPPNEISMKLLILIENMISFVSPDYADGRLALRSAVVAEKALPSNFNSLRNGACCMLGHLYEPEAYDFIEVSAP